MKISKLFLIASTSMAFMTPALAQTTTSGLPAVSNPLPTDVFSGFPAAGGIGTARKYTASQIMNLGAQSDTFFGSGRPWCDVQAEGATGDGSDDDTQYFNKCVTILSGLGGGTVFMPPAKNGQYCIKTSGGVVVNAPYINFAGAAKSAGVMSSCHVETTVLTLNAHDDEFRHIIIYGKGSNNDTTTFGAVNPALVLGSNCIDCYGTDWEVYGGAPPILYQSGEADLIWGRADNSYGTALLVTRGVSPSQIAGGWLIRLKLDPEWPVCVPSYPTAIVSWSAGVPIARCSIVKTQGYFIQASQAGTTGSVAPTLKNYGIGINDGSVVWQLASPVQFSALQVDSNSLEIYADTLDLTGAGMAGFEMTNSVSGGSAPILFRCVECLASQEYQAAFWARAGTRLYLTAPEANCIESGCSSIYYSDSFGGQSNIMGGESNGSGYGVFIGVGQNYSVMGMSQIGNGTADYIGSAAAYVSIMGNNIQNSTNGIATQPGATHYNIIGNTCNNVTNPISDAAGASSSTVLPCN